MGADFFPVLVALLNWGEQWLGPAVVRMRHHGCGALVHTDVRCEAGHPLEIADVDLVADGRRRG
jgi:hypothetical protein